jgi:hypothetical protein
MAHVSVTTIAHTGGEVSSARQGTIGTRRDSYALTCSASGGQTCSDSYVYACMHARWSVRTNKPNAADVSSVAHARNPLVMTAMADVSPVVTDGALVKVGAHKLHNK